MSCRRWTNQGLGNLIRITIKRRATNTKSGRSTISLYRTLLVVQWPNPLVSLFFFTWPRLQPNTNPSTTAHSWLRHTVMDRASLQSSGLSRLAWALVSDRQVGIRKGGRHRAHCRWKLKEKPQNIRRWEGTLWASHAMIPPRHGKRISNPNFHLVAFHAKVPNSNSGLRILSSSRSNDHMSTLQGLKFGVCVKSWRKIRIRKVRWLQSLSRKLHYNPMIIINTRIRSVPF